jgi:hypothetical protein
MPRKTFIDYLDAGARWTGIPTVEPVRRRRMRWLSTVVLAMAAAGFLVSFGRARVGVGDAMLMLGLGLSIFPAIWGPVKPWGETARVDEYDRMLRARAYLFAFAVLSGVAVFGTLAIVGFSLLQDWKVDLLQKALLNMAFFMTVIFDVAPTCYASWAQKPVSDEP